MVERNETVSILIPFYNCPYVGQAVQSALAQSYPHIEVIVIDDGSTMYKERISSYLSRITYLEKENNGVASAMNFGIKQAKSDYFVWLSSDDTIHPDKVRHQLNFMQRKNAFLSCTNFNTMNKNSEIIKYNAGLHFNNDLEPLKLLQNYNPINGCTVMFSKKVVETVGLFNEQLKYAQDYEYWLRVALQYPIHYFPMTLTNYRIHDDMGTVRHKEEITNEFHYVRDQYHDAIGNLINIRSNNQLDQ